MRNPRARVTSHLLAPKSSLDEHPMAALWNLVTSPLKRLSVGVGILSPSMADDFKALENNAHAGPAVARPGAARKPSSSSSCSTKKAGDGENSARQANVLSGGKAAKKVAKKESFGVNHKKAPALVKVKSEKMRSSLRKKSHKAG